MHTYVEAATRRSFYAANTGLSCAINHCHPRSREKVRGGRAGRKLGRRKAKERRKVEEAKEEAGLSGVSTLVPLSFRTRDASLSLGRDSGVFSIDSIHRGHLSGIRRGNKKKDRKCSTSSELTFRIVLQRQLTFCDRKLGSSRRFIE